jgi:hypothetical protein
VPPAGDEPAAPKPARRAKAATRKAPAKKPARARAPARKAAAPAPEPGPVQAVVFVLDGDEYALPIGQVQEVINYTEPRSISSEVSWVRGVINLRGTTLPVCDLAARLGRPRHGSGVGPDRRRPERRRPGGPGRRRRAGGADDRPRPARGADGHERPRDHRHREARRAPRRARRRAGRAGRRGARPAGLTPAALKARPARAITERHYAHTLIEDRDLVLRRARALMLRVAGARVLRPPEARALGRRGLARRRVTLWQDAHTTPAGMRRFVVLRRL